jgi:hypothetical protein
LHLHTCVYIVCTIFILLPLSLPPPPLPLVPTPPSPTAEPILPSCKRKNIKEQTRNMTLCYFEIKIATQGVSLCCSHAYVYYCSSWLASSSPLHSSLVCFPWWSQPV